VCIHVITPTSDRLRLRNTETYRNVSQMFHFTRRSWCTEFDGFSQRHISKQSLRCALATILHVWQAATVLWRKQGTQTVSSISTPGSTDIEQKSDVAKLRHAICHHQRLTEPVLVQSQSFIDCYIRGVLSIVLCVFQFGKWELASVSKPNTANIRYVLSSWVLHGGLL